MFPLNTEKRLIHVSFWAKLVNVKSMQCEIKQEKLQFQFSYCINDGITFRYFLGIEVNVGCGEVGYVANGAQTFFLPLFLFF